MQSQTKTKNFLKKTNIAKIRDDSESKNGEVTQGVFAVLKK